MKNPTLDNILLLIIVNRHRIDFLIRKTVAAAFLHGMKDVSYTLIQGLILFCI
jgi:hypothetical protein